MKFFALIALFALATETEALSLNQLASADPAHEGEGKEAKPAPAPKAAEKKPEKPAEEPKAAEVGKLKDPAEEAKKAADDALANKADAAVDAGTKAADEKAGPPRERTAAEKTRDHILGVARVGQEAIDSNEKNNKDIADRYAKQDKIWADAHAAGTSGSAIAAANDKEWARKAKEAKEAAKTSRSEGEKWTENMGSAEGGVIDGTNKAPILQSTAV